MCSICCKPVLWSCDLGSGLPPKAPLPLSGCRKSRKRHMLRRPVEARPGRDVNEGIRHQYNHRWSSFLQGTLIKVCRFPVFHWAYYSTVTYCIHDYINYICVYIYIHVIYDACDSSSNQVLHTRMQYPARLFSVFLENDTGGKNLLTMQYVLGCANRRAPCKPIQCSCAKRCDIVRAEL